MLFLFRHRVKRVFFIVLIVAVFLTAFSWYRGFSALRRTVIVPLLNHTASQLSGSSSMDSSRHLETLSNQSAHSEAQKQFDNSYDDKSSYVNDKYRYEEELAHILEGRFKKFSEDKKDMKAVICDNTTIPSRSCFDTTCARQFSPSARERVHQILATRTDLPERYRSVMTSATRNVTSHKYIFATASSSNHYTETQALFYNVHTVLLPKMQGRDYVIVFFDIGLKPEQRTLMQKHCRCMVIDFPFSQLPDFLRNLTCYTWKPIIIASLLPKAEHLVWMDASIRFQTKTPLDAIFERSKERGYQTGINGGSIAVRTVQSMASFFGDQVCQYSPFVETEANLGFFYNDRFTNELIIQPWLSCVYDTQCMCVANHTHLMKCYAPYPRRYERCHRYDQSGLGIILSKLYLDYRPMVYLPTGHSIRVERGNTMRWFM